jgi:hypothetical protein
LIHTEKASKQLDKIIAKNMIKYQFVSADELTYGNNEMIGSVKKGDRRDELLHDASIMSGHDLFDKYFPDNAKTRVKRFIRIVLVKTGLYNQLKYRLFIHRRNKAKK